jgi:hypothetical protein
VKRGVVERDFDVSGVTGTGKVSTFCINDDGRIVIFWPTGHGYFDSLEEAIKVHGHNGHTRFVILDDPELDTPEHCEACHYSDADRGAPLCGLHKAKGCPSCLEIAG